MLLYEKTAEQLKNNIKEGIYAFRKFPSEKELADQLGVSGITARRAIQELVNENILLRLPNGRPVIAERTNDAAHLSIAWLQPAFKSAAYDRFFATFSVFLYNEGQGDFITVRPIYYSRWDDPLLWDALEGFDSAFLIPPSERIPVDSITKLQNLPRLPVVLGTDLSEFGLPSMLTYPPIWTQHILDHLAERGHSNIACLNVQPTDSDVLARINQWRLWMSAHGLSGQLVNESVKSFESTYAVACEVASQMLADNFTATAVFCVTLPAAIGLYRALYDRGGKPGRELAVATIDGEAMAATLAPSLTCMREPDMTPYFRMCLNWMRSSNAWEGPLLLRPENTVVDVLESTSQVTGVASGRWAQLCS